MSGIILHQTIVMLLLMLCGALCRKTGIVSSAANRELSSFVIQIVNPAVIFMSYQADYEDRLVRNLLICFALSAAVMGVMIACAYILVPKKEGRETAIERFSSIYSNCGFMGIPLVNSLFGSEGVFYLTAFITVFNIVVWTHGLIMLTGERDMKKLIKVFCSPTIISIFLGIICFFLRIRLPEIPSAAVGYIAALNTPLAMIVSGITMSENKLSSLLKESGVYRVCFFKLIVIPVVVSAVISLTALIPVDEKVRLTVLVAASAPPAAICTLQCLKYGKNSHYASQIFTAGTILSVITLPLIVKVTETLTKMILFVC
ncbi:MAG: AEC family transporter [Ruminococcus sp.]|nr:AEC family transporter [Ruminococcus sp.]